MMKNLSIKSTLFTVIALFLTACQTDDNTSEGPIPFTADVFNSVNGKKKVAFQGLTNNAVSWNWDFGDGSTSNQQNPVHTYADSGYYTATLTATDATGATLSKEVQLALDITPYVLLTGGVLPMTMEKPGDFLVPILIVTISEIPMRL